MERYLRFVLGVKEIFIAKLGHPETLEQEMFDSNLWIIEAFDPKDPYNPEGFRTAKRLASKIPVLLLFIGDLPFDFPKEGDFWITLPSSTSIASKIRRVISEPPLPKMLEFFENLFPSLRREPYHHS